MAASEEILRQELESLSPEELDEYEKRLLAESSVETPSEPVEAPEETSTLQAVGLGAIEGVPFAKDVIAAGETLLESGANDFSENFSKNQDEWNDLLNKAEEEHPVAFTAGDIGVGFALPAARGLKGMMAFGALSSLSRSEDRTVFDAAYGAALGGAVGKAAQFAASKVAKLGNSLGVTANETLKDAVDGEVHRAKLNTHINKWFKGNTLAEKSKKYADYVVKHGIVDKSDDIESVSKKFTNLKQVADEEINELISKADVVLDDTDISKLVGRFTESLNLEQLAESTGVEGAARASKLQNMIKRTFIKYAPTRDVTEKVVKGLDRNGNPVIEEIVRQIPDGPVVYNKFSLKELHNLKKFYGAQAKAAFDKAATGMPIEKVDFYKRGAGILAETIDELTSDDKLLKAANMKYAVGAVGEELSNSVVMGMKGGAVSKIRNMFNLRTVLLATGAVGGGSVGGGPGAAAGVATAATIAKVMSLSKDPNIHPKFAMQLRSLSDHLSVNPSSKYLQRLATASSLSIDSFRDALSGVFSEIELAKMPIARTAEAVKAKSDDILQALEYHSKPAASALRKALDTDDDDTISAVMADIAKNPETRDFIEPGKGWNGKVYHPEDVEEMRQQVESMDMSLQSKLQHLKDLEQKGIIPVIQAEPNRFFEFKKRDKKKPRF